MNRTAAALACALGLVTASSACAGADWKLAVGTRPTTTLGTAGALATSTTSAGQPSPQAAATSAPAVGPATSLPAPGGPSTSANPSPTAPPSTSALADGRRSFTDGQTGFTISYPDTFSVAPATGQGVRFKLRTGSNETLDVRVVPTQQVATEQNLATFKPLTAADANGGNVNRTLYEDVETINDLPAYYYLYVVRAPGAAQEGVRGQVFVFEGKRMFVITLETPSLARFGELASAWDDIVESFTVKPS